MTLVDCPPLRLSNDGKVVKLGCTGIMPEPSAKPRKADEWVIGQQGRGCAVSGISLNAASATAREHGTAGLVKGRPPLGANRLESRISGRVGVYVFAGRLPVL